MVTIRVGSQPEIFYVHQAVLEKAGGSRFFQVAFRNGFRETRTHVLDLPEDDVETFSILMQCVYGMSTSFANCEKSPFFEKVEPSTLLRLYALASKYMMDDLHDAIITRMWCLHNDPYPALPTWAKLDLTEDAFLYFEQNTMVGCPMDELLSDWMAYDTLKGKSAEYDAQPAAFEVVPVRLMRATFIKANISPALVTKSGNHLLCERPGKSRSWEGHLCSYHCLDRKQACPAPCYTCATSY